MQSNIIVQFKEYEYINLINKFAFFLQFVIVEQDKYKFFFIIYREKEQLNIVVIRFKNFSIYMQQVIDKQLQLFCNFCKIYINNIVFFFKFFVEYINYLQ